MLKLILYVAAVTAELSIPVDILKDHPSTGDQNGTIAEYVNENMVDMNRGYGAEINNVVLFDLNNYGCWCEGANLARGHGNYQDDFDKICYNKYRGFECLKMDAEGRGESCNPRTQSYEFDASIVMKDGVPKEVVITCKDTNTVSFCSKNTCLIELRAMIDNFKLQAEHYYPEVEAFGHIGYFDQRGSFEPTLGNCRPDGQGTNSNTLECCGDYPFRNWFYHDTQIVKECCRYENDAIQVKWNDNNLKVGKAYNPVFEVCCDSGVKSPGSC